MRLIHGLGLVLIAFPAAALAQTDGFPVLFSAVGAADFSAAGTVGIPPGSILTLTGLNLSASTVTVNGPKLPTEVSGVSAVISTDAAGGNIVAEAPLLYVSPTQINAILPSSVPVGQYFAHVKTTVVLGGNVLPITVGSVPVTVTGGRFAPFTRQSKGFGPAVVQQYDAAGAPTLNEFTASAAPGSVMALWGTGLGALPKGSDGDPAPAGDIRRDVTVYVAGVPVQPLYAGRGPGLFGVDQIDFRLPADIKTGCFVPLQVATGGVFSGVVTISISEAGAICPSEFGFSPATLFRLDSGGTIVADVLELSSTTAGPVGTLTQSADSWRGLYDASTLAAVATSVFPPVPGAFTCTTGPSLPVNLKGLSQMPGVAPPSSWVAGNAFPPPLPTTVITAFAAVRANGQFTANWTVAPAPNRSVTITAASHYLDPGLFGAMSHYYSGQASCVVSAGASPFTFPAADYAQALAYSVADPASLTVTDTEYKAYPGSAPTDVAIVVTLDSVMATANVR